MTWLGISTALLVVIAALHLRADRTRALVERAGKQRSVGLFTRLGRYFARARLLNSFGDSDVRSRCLGLTIVVTPVLFLISPKIAVGFAAFATGYPHFAERRQRNLRRHQINRELPIATDLLRLCLGSGLNISKSIEQSTAHLDGPLKEEFLWVQGEVAQGTRLADALDHMNTRLNDDVHALLGALISSERHGAPLSAVLERLSFEARRNQERRAEQAARRLSVQLLFPVAGFILPAFALLTVAPLLAGAFGPLASSFH